MEEKGSTRGDNNMGGGVRVRGVRDYEKREKLGFIFIIQ